MKTITPHYQPSRQAGLARLREFLSLAPQYAAKRNFDLPAHPHVSRLSPCVTVRLLTEEEIVSAVLKEHPLQQVEKFVQEVCWRTYWKGWLELRPAVWSDYLHDLEKLPRDSDLLLAAQNGHTGIDCFDYWCTELCRTGYLHNHARMWFASIWIFTLGLPWQLGANHFFRHLLDGDAASNTLSWRWVAGLQTPGKTYVARAENIEKFTAGRFHPAGKINESPQQSAFTSPIYPPDAASFSGLGQQPAANPNIRRGLLILGEDCCPETSALRTVPFHSVAAGWDQRMGARHGFVPGVQAFRRAALEDALGRAQQNWRLRPECVVRLREEDWSASVVDWCRSQSLEEIVCILPAIGPWRESYDELLRKHAGEIRLTTVIRKWDQTFWPHATKGFFPFKEKIPRLLSQIFNAAP